MIDALVGMWTLSMFRNISQPLQQVCMGTWYQDYQPNQDERNLVEEPDLKFIANEAIRSVSDLLENFNLFKSDQNEYRILVHA